MQTKNLPTTSVHKTIALTLAKAIDSHGALSKGIFLDNGLNIEEIQKSDSPVDAGLLQKVWRDDAGIALFLQLCRFAHNESFCSLAVQFQRPIPNNRAKFDEYFRCKVTYESAENCLLLTKDQLSEPLVVLNPDLARANDQVVIDYLQRFEQTSVSSRATSYIIDSLPSRSPSQQSVANHMAMSGRTLQRKLAAENTSLKQMRLDLTNAMIIRCHIE